MRNPGRVEVGEDGANSAPKYPKNIPVLGLVSFVQLDQVMWRFLLCEQAKRREHGR